MEALAGTLAYPVLEVGMRITALFGEIGLSMFLASILLCSAALCVDAQRTLAQSIVQLLVPFMAWCVMFALSQNSGLGNFVLELGALMASMIVACAVLKLVRKTIGRDSHWLIYSPHAVVFVLALILRSLMPLVGK